jgi:hypothetical protein
MIFFISGAGSPDSACHGVLFFPASSWKNHVRPEKHVGQISGYSFGKLKEPNLPCHLSGIVKLSNQPEMGRSIFAGLNQ